MDADIEGGALFGQLDHLGEPGAGRHDRAAGDEAECGQQGERLVRAMADAQIVDMRDQHPGMARRIERHDLAHVT